MLSDGYQYILELSKRPSGALLGRIPIQADWVPIQEALALDLVRRSGRADFGERPTLRIEPQWTARAADGVICGVRKTGVLGDHATSSLTVSVDYFRALAQHAADQFVEMGELQAGDLFEYRVLAYERPPTTKPASRRLAVEQIAAPVPITPAVLEDFTDRAVLLDVGAGDDIPVFVHWRVLQEAAVMTREAGAMECGGILVGHVRRDPAVSDLLLEVTAQIPASARGELTRLSFSPDTWSAVQAALNARGRKEVWLGWWHSHSFFKQEQASEGKDPAGRKRPPMPFLSPEDRLLHRTVFPRRYSLALLMTDSPHSGMSWTMFGWRDGIIVRRDFHVVDLPLPESFTALRGNNHATT